MQTFNRSGNYTCVCGKIFTRSQSFNGHKTHCHLHQLLKHGSLEPLYENQRLQQLTKKQNRTPQKQEKSATKCSYLNEEVYCEKCGIRLTEKFGSGRFCSRKCANSHSRNQESREKTSISIKRFIEENPEYKDREHKTLRKPSVLSRTLYNKNPNKCSICAKDLPYEKRSRKTCSKECYKKLCSELVNARINAGTHNGWNSRKIRSYAEKFWESVLVNNSIPFVPEFKVVIPGSKYFLDFKIGENLDLEIDGVQHKQAAHIKHDELRDATLKKLGYVIYRIPYIPPTKTSEIKEQIDSFLAFYTAYSLNNI